MEQLAKVFTYESAEVRTVMVEGEPWFVAKDVCVVLGLSNVSLAVNGNPTRGDLGLDEDEKGVCTVNTLGGNQNLLCVTESGVYELVFKSRKPEARAFKRWITHEVIPSIRKTGMYATDALLDDPDLLLKTVTRLAEERRARLEAEERAAVLQVETIRQADVIEEQSERLTYMDEILRSDDTMTVTQIGQDYDLSAVALNAILEEARIQRRVGKQWVLYRKYHGLGLIKSHTKTVPTEFGHKVVVSTQWTQAGRLLIHQTLKKRGVTALVDLGTDLPIRQCGNNVIRMPARRSPAVTLNLRVDAR
jgi:prophage antirepressor-like protein